MNGSSIAATQGTSVTETDDDAKTAPTNITQEADEVIMVIAEEENKQETDRNRQDEEDKPEKVINGVRLYETPMLLELLELQSKDTKLVDSHPLAISYDIGDNKSIVMVGSRVIVPEHAIKFKQRALELAHDYGGHGGVREVFYRLKRIYYWREMVGDVKRFVASCHVCQKVKTPHSAQQVGRLTPLVHNTPRIKWLVDYQGPLPTQKGDIYIGILTFTDAASRLLIAVPVPAFTAEIAKEMFYQHILAPFGRPEEIQVDDGAQFKSVFAEECRKLGIKLHVSHSNYHEPMGVAEKQHDILLDKIKTELQGPKDKDWAKKVALATYHLNGSINGSIKESPRKVMFGSDTRDSLLVTAGLETVEEAVHNSTKRRRAVQELAFQSSVLAAVKSKAAYDKRNGPPPVYHEGEAILLFFEGRDDKLSSYYRGPYYVVKKDDVDGNFYTVGEKGDKSETISKHQSVSVRRMKRYNMSRSDFGIEESWKHGPAYRYVKYIKGHEIDEGAKEIRFYVVWDAGDGTEDEGEADIRDIRYNMNFEQYCKQHGIKQSWITRHVKLVRSRTKTRNNEENEDTMLITDPSNDEEPESSILRTRARKVVRAAPRGEVLEDGLPPSEPRKFQVNQDVFFRLDPRYNLVMGTTSS